MSRNKSEIRLVIMAGVLCVTLLPLLLAADPFAPDHVPADVAEARREQIERMSVVERERLKRRFQRFLALPESRRALYRQLYRELEADERAGGDLRRVMHVYYNWLMTLSPWQREELHKTADPVEKMKLVRKFKGQQRIEQARPRRVYPGSLGRHLGRFMGFGHRLNSADLEKVMQVVENSVPLPRDVRGKIENMQGVNRYLLTLESVLKPDAALGRSGKAPWPDGPLMEQMQTSISDEKLRERLASIHQPDRRRRYLVRLIVSALVAEVQAVAEQRKPSQADLDKLFIELDDTRRDEIMRLPIEEARKRLALLSFSKQGAKFPVDTRRMRHVVQLMFRRSGFRPPRGPRPPFSGGRRFGPRGKRSPTEDPD